MCLCSGSERLFPCSLLSTGCNVFMVYHRISVCLQVKEDFCISILRFTDNTSEAKSIPVHNLVQKQLHISPSDTCGDWVIRSKLRTDFILCAGFTQSEIICRKPLGYLKWSTIALIGKICMLLWAYLCRFQSARYSDQGFPAGIPVNYVGVHIPVYLERHLWAVSTVKPEKLSILWVENKREKMEI